MRKKYLDEHDRDIFEEEEAYERWLEGKPQPPFRPDEQPDDGYRENDPYDRLRSEGGHLSE